MGKGKTIRSERRNVILNVLNFFETEKANKVVSFPVDQVIKRTVAATGVSDRTILRIKAEAKEIANQVKSPSTSTPSRSINLPTPGKKRKPSRQKISLNGFELCALRNIVNNFYAVRQEIPTLRNILSIAKRELDFPGQISTLRCILIQKLGFKFKKCKKSQHVLVLKPDIAAWRARYLRRLKENDDLGINKRPVIYVDDMLINSEFTGKKCLDSKTTEAAVQNHFKPGECWILIHAGGERGFIPGEALMYIFESTTTAYSQQMDAGDFTNWVQEKLIPNLPSNSIVVLNNSGYNKAQTNKLPRISACVTDLKKWLREHNISYTENMTKPELYYLLLKAKPQKEYIVDKLFREHGHEVLRLPPHHCDLNPIVGVWKQVKQNITDKLDTQSDIETIVKDVISSVTNSVWEKEVSQVDRLRQRYWRNDRLAEVFQVESIISLGEDSAESDSVDSESDDEDAMSDIEVTNYSDADDE